MFEDEQIILTLKAGPDSGIGKFNFEVVLSVEDAKQVIDLFLLKKKEAEEPQVMNLMQRRRKAKEMHEAGFSLQDICDAVGASADSVRRYIAYEDPKI